MFCQLFLCIKKLTSNLIFWDLTLLVKKPWKVTESNLRKHSTFLRGNSLISWPHLLIIELWLVLPSSCTVAANRSVDHEIDKILSHFLSVCLSCPRAIRFGMTGWGLNNNFARWENKNLILSWVLSLQGRLLVRTYVAIWWAWPGRARWPRPGGIFVNKKH